MSAPSDHEHEMLNDDTLTDEAIEAFFVGLADPAWEHDASLATLADDMAVAMNAPAPVADHALLQLFWETPAPAETTPASVPAWNVPVAVIGDTRSVGWFHGRLRLIAGAALGAVLALSGVGVAGAAGALPAPVQRVVAGVVEAVSPFELPDAGGNSPSGGGAANRGDGTGGQAPTADKQPAVSQEPAVSAPGASSDGPQATPPTFPPSSGPPTGPGSGLDTARQTPAGQSVPLPIPGPAPLPNPSPDGSGNAPAFGLDTARQTPAAAAPTSEPGPPTAGSAPARNR